MTKLYEKDRMVCRKCGSSHFQINWNFESESAVMGALMCHRGFGLELSWSDITCVRCGSTGNYTDEKLFKIRTLKGAKANEPFVPLKGKLNTKSV